MWPKNFWYKIYEPIIRKAAGLGVAPLKPDPDRYEKTNVHCDVLIVGGGPSGLAAALESGRTGARVILVDEQNELGGTLLTNIDQIDGDSSSDWIRAVEHELNRMPNVQILSRTTAFGYYDHNMMVMFERTKDHIESTNKYTPRQKLWYIRAKEVILSTGSIERPLVFGNNDRPGIMLVSAAIISADLVGLSDSKNNTFISCSLISSITLTNCLGVTLSSVVTLGMIVTKTSTAYLFSK